MNTVVDILDYIKSSFSQNCSNITFVNSYPSDLTEFPIKQPTVSVGVESIKLPFKGGLFIGLNTGLVREYGISAECLIKLNICLPKTMSGIDLYSAFDSIVNACLTMNDVTIIDINAGGIHYDRIMGAIVLEASINLSAVIVSEGEALIDEEPEDDDSEDEDSEE